MHAYDTDVGQGCRCRHRTIAIEHGLILCSTDSDFVRFPALRWTNPLQA
jgi:hypothetical protein